MLLGEQPDARADIGRRAARPQRHRQGQRAVDRALPRPAAARSARRVPARHASAGSTRCSALTTESGTRRASRPKARARTGSSWRSACSTAGTTTRTSARRSSGPGFLEGPVADLSLARIPPKASAVRRRQEGRRAAGYDGRVRRRRATRRSSRRSASRPKVARCSSSAAPTPDGRARPWTAARSRGSRVVVGPATRRAPSGVVRVGGDQELGNRVVDNMAFTI